MKTIQVEFLSVALLCISFMLLFGPSGKFTKTPSQIRTVLQKWKAPFRFLRQKLIRFRQFKHRKDALELELSQSISFLRNILAGVEISDSSLPSLDQILEELSEWEGILGEAYGALLRNLRQNDPEEGIKEFSQICDISEGKDVTRLLMEWDSLAPEELKETLYSYQKHLSEMRYTTQKQREELISDLIYLPVTLNVVLVFINFLYIGYFMEQKELLNLFVAY